MEQHLETIEFHLMELLDVLDSTTNKNDTIQYCKTKVAILLAYIDECYPHSEVEQFHMNEEDVEHCQEGYV